MEAEPRSEREFLLQEAARARGRLSDTRRQLQSSCRERLSPTAWIRRYPKSTVAGLSAVGTTLGLWLTRRNRTPAAPTVPLYPPLYFAGATSAGATPPRSQSPGFVAGLLRSLFVSLAPVAKLAITRYLVQLVESLNATPEPDSAASDTADVTSESEEFVPAG